MLPGELQVIARGQLIANRLEFQVDVVHDRPHRGLPHRSKDTPTRLAIDHVRNPPSRSPPPSAGRSVSRKRPNRWEYCGFAEHHGQSHRQYVLVSLTHRSEQRLNILIEFTDGERVAGGLLRAQQHFDLRNFHLLPPADLRCRDVGQLCRNTSRTGNCAPTTRITMSLRPMSTSSIRSRNYLT